MTTANSTEPGAMPEASPRCLILVGRDASSADPLVKRMQARGATVVTAHDALSVMTELAHAPTGVLIVVQPRRTRRLAELMAAVSCYHPSLRCWEYEPGHSGSAGQLRKRSVDRSSPPPHAGMHSTPSRERRDSSEQSPARDVSVEDADQDGPLLSAEELRMLMEDSPR